MNESMLATALYGVGIFTSIGVVFGLTLAAVAKRFQVPVNPLVERVRAYLPSANCGACGFAGCQAYAEAVVERGDVSPNLCIPGRAAVAQAIAEATGKTMGTVADRVVVMRCHGTSAFAREEARYIGVDTCAAASLVFGGPKACKNGCLGLGDCVRACPFDALFLSPDGIAAVDYDKCTGCGVCVPVCPKELFQLYPRDRRIELSCVAKDKQSVVRATCMVGCTLCRKCVTKCPAGAIEWDGRTIIIHHDICLAYGPSCNEACVDICPSTILHRVGQRPRPEPVEPPLAV
ncbi:MAG TPA: Fe-S cluster domain-containing protein [Candidatus Eisenbacteria bacterium]|nr:Fe-S cluster domain-containing protein [Candidatus Eisenbacteria bacterium]